MINMQRHRTIPPIRTGYPINGGRCPFSVVVPQARTNLVFNPSFETNTTSWLDEDETGIGSVAVRSTVQQFAGAYSLLVTPTSGNRGVFYPQSGGSASFSTTSGTTYAVSMRFLGTVPNVEYRLGVTTTTAGGGTVLASNTFKSTGRWQWIWCIFTETSSTSRRIYIVHTGSGGGIPFYLDCVQIEACETGNYWPTTYIDGDQQGLISNQFPPAYVWNGTPHASTSSRSAQTRAGGRVINLSRFGLLLTAIVGLGLVPPEHQGQNFAVLDGSQYDRTRKPDRSFSLIGRIDAPDDLLLRRYRGDLAAVLDRDLIGDQQPLKLLYQTTDEWGSPTSDEAEIVALYQSGLEGNHDNDYAQDAVISFTQKLPIIYLSGSEGATLGVQTSVANADRLITRTPDGVWQVVGTSGSNGVIQAIAIAPNGDVFVGGDFTNIGGSGADYIARWDGSAWNTVGSATALNSMVHALAFGPDGILYVGGSFTNAGGNANADGIATWNGSAWGNLSTGTAGTILALAVTSTGTLYVGGGFSSIGASGADNIALWNGSAWANLASDTALNNSVYSLVIGLDGKLYVGGDFTNANGIADADRIASWNGTSWAALSTGTANSVWALAVGSDGLIYAGGSFTAIGGVTASHVAKWNGVIWQPLGSGVTTDVFTLALIGNQLYVGGAVATAGGVPVPDGFAIWTNSSWVYSDVDLPGSAVVYALAAKKDGTLYVGYDTAGSATVGSTTTIANTGTAKAYPTVVIKGPSSGTARIFRIANVTNGRAIYMNYTINSGETATLVLDPSNLSFTSDFQGNIANTILPGSNEADFFLQPGANIISFLSASSSVTAFMAWRSTLTSLDDLVLTP